MSEDRMTDAKFATFTSRLAREIKGRERKRLLRFVLGLSVILAVLIGMLVHQQSQAFELRTKLRDQCIARNQILQLQRDLYGTMAKIDTEEPEHREAWDKIFFNLPPDRDCADFMR